MIEIGVLRGGLTYLYGPILKQVIGIDNKVTGNNIITGSSHKKTTFDAVSRELAGKLADVLFIDGDHSYEGARMDFEMYSKLVRKGGIIAFHDIVKQNKEVNKKIPYPIFIYKLWEEIKEYYKFRWEEIIDESAPEWGGIGVIWK